MQEMEMSGDTTSRFPLNREKRYYKKQTQENVMRCSPANFKISLPRLAPNRPFPKFGRRRARAGSPPAYSPSGQLRISSARFAIFTWAASRRQRSFWKYDSAGGADRWGRKQRDKKHKAPKQLSTRIRSFYSRWLNAATPTESSHTPLLNKNF